MSLSVGIDEMHLMKNVKLKNANMMISVFRKACMQRTRLGDVAVFENRQPVTAAKFITKSSLFILLLGVIRRLNRPEKS